MFVHTSYRESGASALVNYIEQDHPLRNSAGRELSGHEVRDFIDKSERHEFEREFQLSPDPEAAVSQRALERQTQRFIGEFLTNRRSVRAVYAYHGSTDVPHAHVAMTGKRRDLFVDRDDLARMRQQLEQRLEQRQTQDQELRQDQAQDQRQRLRVEHELDQVQSQHLELRPENQQEQDQEQEQTLRQNQRYGL